MRDRTDQTVAEWVVGDDEDADHDLPPEHTALPCAIWLGENARARSRGRVGKVC